MIPNAIRRSKGSQCTSKVESASNTQPRDQCLIPNHASLLVLINHIKNFQLRGDDLLRSLEQKWISLLKNIQM